jgi:SAM-dependent methyltransferase
MSDERESAATGLDRQGTENARRPSLNQIAPLTPHAWLRYDVIQRMLPPGVATVLEVGCGQGALGARLSTRYRYLGIEPDADSFGVAKGRFAQLGDLGRGEVRETTVESLPAEEKFDMVCAFEVLEHIDDDAGALKEWAQRLNPGGYLLISVPAHQSRYGPSDQVVGHFRRYEPAQLAAMVKELGLGDIDVREYGAPLGYALEGARNALGRRRLQKMNDVSFEERTGGSGRQFQPTNAAMGALAFYGTAPFRYMQRSFQHGTGVVLRARLAG